MPQTVLGIDCGSYSVKIAQVERGFGEFKLIGFYEVPLVAEEVLTYEQAASAALTKFFEENPINYDYSVLSLPGHRVAFRSLEMPFGTAKKVDQTFAFELETVIPFEVEEILYDYTILSSSPQMSKVLATYLKEEDFKRFLSQIQTSGVDPRYVGVDTLDLSYLTHLGVLPLQGRYALLDMGHSKTNFLVLEGNQVQTLRAFSWGGHTLTRAIANATKLNYDQAEQLKHNKGQLVEGSQDLVHQAIRTEVEDLMQQMKQTLFAFYESGETTIDALYLSGGTSRLQGLDSFFSNRLNINVSALDVLEDTHTQILDRENARPIVPTALGMALRAVFPGKGVKINFRRGDYAYKRDIEQLGGTLKKLGMMAALVFVLGITYFIVSYMNLSSQISKMNKNVAAILKASVTGLPKDGIKTSSSALTFLQGKISEVDEKLKKLQGGNSMGALSVLKQVSAALPPRDQLVLDIDDINITQDRVRLEGRTVSYEGVDKVKAALQKVANFKNVETGNVRKGVRDEIKFSLSFDVSG